MLNDQYASRVIILVVWMFVGWLIAWLKYMASPMNIPPECGAELEQEKGFRWMLFFIPIGGYMVCAALVYIVGVTLYDYYKKRAKGERKPHRYFPHVSLAELMGMSIALAIFPMMVFGNEFKTDDPERVTQVLIAMGAAITLFPFIFVIAYNRLNARKVPHGRWRTLYVALHPLMFFAVILQPLTLYSIGIWRDEFFEFQLWLGVSVIVFESYVSYRARKAADRSEMSQINVSY